MKNLITVYHGTNAQNANMIKVFKSLKGKGVFGAGVCKNIEQAINFSAILNIRFGKLAYKVGRIVKFQIPQELLKYSSIENVPEAYTLNDENGKPIINYKIEGKIEILTIREAQKFIK